MTRDESYKQGEQVLKLFNYADKNEDKVLSEDELKNIVEVKNRVNNAFNEIKQKAKGEDNAKLATVGACSVGGALAMADCA